MIGRSLTPAEVRLVHMRVACDTAGVDPDKTTFMGMSVERLTLEDLRVILAYELIVRHRLGNNAATPPEVTTE